VTTNHRAEAERRLLMAWEEDSTPERNAHLVAEAQVHATLAAGETAAVDAAAYRHTIQSLRFALVRQVAEGLALSEGDEAHQHARGLAQHLDSVGLNVDREVDAYIESLGWGDPRDAWLSPTARHEKWAADCKSPWDDTSA
jgi:hypothetical protein